MGKFSLDFLSKIGYNNAMIANFMTFLLKDGSGDCFLGLYLENYRASNSMQAISKGDTADTWPFRHIDCLENCRRLIFGAMCFFRYTAIRSTISINSFGSILNTNHFFQKKCPLMRQIRRL
jgi:hypothetical protein